MQILRGSNHISTSVYHEFFMEVRTCPALPIFLVFSLVIAVFDLYGFAPIPLITDAILSVKIIM